MFQKREREREAGRREEKRGFDVKENEERGR
jgi:hypothetical protein